MFRLLLLVFILISCQSKIPSKKVDDDLVLRQRTFVDELYMPSITPWSNFSDFAGCNRESDWHYLNFNEVKKKTGFDFMQILNLQYQINNLWFQKKPFMTAETNVNYVEKLKPNDRLSLFEQSLELVNGGVAFWNKAALNFPIWLIDWDSIDANQKLSYMTSILALPELKNSIPVIVSRCSSSFTIKKSLELQPELLSFSFILGVEVMTPFSDNDLAPLTYLHHPIEFYFPEGANMTWLLPASKKPQSKKDKIRLEGKDYKVFYL